VASLAELKMAPNHDKQAARSLATAIKIVEKHENLTANRPKPQKWYKKKGALLLHDV
jgi:hypothetical protein